MNYSYTENASGITNVLMLECAWHDAQHMLRDAMFVHSFSHSLVHSFTEIQAEGETA